MLPFNDVLRHRPTVVLAVEGGDRECVPSKDERCNLSVVAKGGMHPAWRKVVGWFEDDAFVAPVPVVRNAGVEEVVLEAEPGRPGLGDPVAGMFSVA